MDEKKGKVILAYPCKPYGLNQPFGTNPYVYSRYGIKGHNGLDFFAPDGVEVRASHDGLVTEVGYDQDGGLGVVLEGEDCDGFYKTIYWHLKKDSPVVIPGQRVKQGDLLALADNTGFSTGSHLHFGYKRLDANKVTLNQDNGFKGSLDPTPLFNGDYAYDIWNLTQQKSILEKIIQIFSDYLMNR